MAATEKQCPVCKRIYSRADSFCARDGARLEEVSGGGGKRKKRIVIVLAALAVTGFLIFNAAPHILRWIGSNFAVSIVGLSFKDQNRSEALIRITRDILEEVLGKGAGDRKKLPGRENKDFSVILSLKNDNFFPVAVHSFHFNFFLNGEKIGKGTLSPEEGRRIGPFEKVEITCPISISASSLVSSAGNVLSSAQLQYRVQGEAVVTILVGKFTFAVDVKGITVQL